ncbi:MAG: YbhB/YbcL family Raf kinase inhibitor-like protein [Polyangiaceae bacterium]|nr:YbhB/YbcL family Raf kinase inhibitor-like protein [Polyangiaceae bacterium]
MRKLFVLAFLSPLTLLAAACGDDTGSGGGATTTTVTSGPGSTTTGTPTTTTTTTTTTATTTASTTMASTTGAGGGGEFALTSTAFNEGDMIPQTYECDNGGGDNISPPFAWTAGPAGTMSYAIVMRDLDFGPGFIHWVIWDIPATETGLPEDLGGGFMVADPAGAKQVNPYFGPCSPNSVNTYEWTLYAIDAATLPGLDQNSNHDEAEAAILDAAIASTTLSGES